MQTKHNSKRVILTFPALSQLWAFCQTLQTQNLEINTRINSLICDCSETDIARAISSYGATVFQEAESNR